MADKVILMILDGWGLGTDPKVSAIAKANTPYVDNLLASYPNSKLEASGIPVGLPDGQMGNSEVGHMNIGAGRIVYQDLVKINMAVEEKTLGNQKVLTDAFDYAKKHDKKVHFIGLVSDGGVHAHIDHLKGLVSLAKELGVEKSFIHAFTDGRDADPKGGAGYIKTLQEHIQDTPTKIASITGRYYAMDRDKRWERVKKAYDAMVHGKGELVSEDLVASLQEQYNNDITYEFMSPIIAKDDGKDYTAKIENGDVVICFNFRTDRGRQITEALTQKAFPKNDMEPLDLHYVTLTNYDDTFKNVHVVFGKDKLSETLGEILEKNGKTQIRIAETEKYPHVTFFFSGGREEEFEGEKRILCPSPKVATYDLKPEMSAWDITEAIVPELKGKTTDFICLNFANPDMVGHTGDFEAAVKACETVDACTKEVIEAAQEGGYTVIVIADHGNPDIMVNDDGSPHTKHTTNLVPCIVVKEGFTGKVQDGKLGDLAPTILKLMEIEKPSAMNGVELI